MTLAYELGLDILKMYLSTKNEDRGFFQKLEYDQTDRQTDATESISSRTHWRVCMVTRTVLQVVRRSVV